MLRDQLLRWLSRTVPDKGNNVSASIPIVLATDVGLERTENQDRVAAMRVDSRSGKRNGFSVVALADGMGGMVDGTSCAVQALANFFNHLATEVSSTAEGLLEDAANAANIGVYQQFRGKGGATLSAVLFTDDRKVLLVNVGDSRIYAMSDADPAVVSRLTVDDSLEEFVGGHGRELLQFIGMGEGLKPHVKNVDKDVKRVLITSDGVHFVSHETLVDVFSKAPDAYRAAERLAALARWCGAPDNASLAIVNIPEVAQCFEGRQDSGVELWDAFGSIKIICERESERQSAYSPLRQRQIEKQNISQEQRALPEIVSTPKKLRKPRKEKEKGEKEKMLSQAAAGPQLTIDIDAGSTDSNSTASENNDDKS
ncbi:PP2C family protein-serine/threonine phosphatase [Cupriavidus pinatubonensis]|uniref:PPM-type phosphatase domain-containing protein n=1 Tax=Cupriavidus pinatubonensis TaxID=248026 RepID=A0ABM8WSG3_9BURK|nr:protein phosphatase 2C domain-containing protein [Cupriavidus pinatubonensis]CAG9170365.1 hypothetical protein LMG23994_01869 [Cupriavidus pinatubonensis]